MSVWKSEPPRSVPWWPNAVATAKSACLASARAPRAASAKAKSVIMQTCAPVWKMPVSELKISVMTRALVPAEEILNTHPITSGEPDLRQEFLLVQLDRKAAVDVMNYTKEAVGRHFVLVINDTAVGIMPIDNQITDGNLIFHVEQKGMSNSQAVMDISRRLNISALKLRKIKESERQ